MPKTTSVVRELYKRAIGRQFGKALLLVVLGLILIGVNLAMPVRGNAATNNTVNFQARLQTNTGAEVNDGTYNVEFKLYSASSGGTALWTEDYLNSNSQGAQVVNGYLSVSLGSVTGFPSNVNWDQQLWLTMNVGGTSSGAVTWDGEMSPRLQITALPYAFRAGMLALQTGANESTLGWASQTTANSILLPNEGGTLCIQTSTNCGFAASSGSTNYIQNRTTLQSAANFNIQSTAAGSVGGAIEGATSQTADLFELKNSGGAVISQFDSQGDLGILSGGYANNALSVGLQNYSTGTIQQAGTTISGTGTTWTSAMTGGTIYYADGTTATITYQASTQLASSISKSVTAGSSYVIAYGGFNVTSGAAATLQPSADSTKAFQVLNSSANNVFAVDTTNNQIVLGKAVASTGKITFNGSGGSGTLTLKGPDIPNTGNFTLSIPAITGNANVCTDNSVCTGYAPSTGGNYIAKNASDTSSASFVGNLLGLTNTNTGAAGVLGLTNSGTNSALSIVQGTNPSNGQALILANNNNATPGGNLIDLQNKGSSKFSVDVSGNITAAGTYNSNTLTSSALTFAGAATATIQPAASQALTLTGHTASTWSTDSGALTLDAAAALNLGTANATSVSVAKAGVATTINGSLTVTQAATFSSTATFNGNVSVSGTNTLSVATGGVSFGGSLGVTGASTFTGLGTFNGGVTLGANQNLTLNSGTGTFTQNYSNSSAGSGSTFNATNSNSTSTATTVNAQKIALTGGTNSNAGANTINGISFANVTPVTNNTFNALAFGTGYDSLLNYAGTSLISGSGLLQNAAIDTGTTYTNLQKVGALSAGSIASGFGSISTGNNISTSATVQGGVVNATTGFQLSGTAPTGHYLRGNGTNYVDSALLFSDLSGTVFTLAASSGASQNVGVGDTVSILQGSSGNITTTASATNTVTVDVVSNPTFSGLITGSSGTTGLALTGAPVAGTGITSLLQIGSAIASGNVASNGGTYIGLNAPNAGAGSAADFINLQKNGSSKLKVTNAGDVIASGALTVSSTVTFSNLNSSGVVHTNGSGQLSTSAVVLGTDTSGNYVATLGALTGLTTSGNTGAGSTPTLAVAYGSSSNTAVQGTTTLVCPSGSGNITGTGNTITLGSGGTCNSLSIVNNPTFSGLITGSSGTTGLALTGAPVAGTGITSLLQIGSAIASGNVASNGGTYIGLNAPNAGAGSAADFLNLEYNGSSKLLVTNTGALTAAGIITFSNLNSSGIVHTNGSGQLSTSAVALGTDTSGNYVANLGSLTGLTTSGNSGAGSTPTLSVTYGASANNAVQGNTTLVCPSGSGNITGTGNTITLGSGGTCNSIGIVNNPSFSGLVTASSNTTGLAVTGTPVAGTGITSLLQLGNAISGGNTNTNGGTYFGINAPGAGGGSAADFLNFELSNASKLKVSSAGDLTAAGIITFINLNSSGIVHTNGSGQLSTSAVALGTDTSGSYVANLGSLTGLTTSGNSGAGSTPTLSVTYGASASTAVQGNTSLICPSGSGNLTGGGNTITLGTGGTCSSLNTVNNPTFSGTVTASNSSGTALAVSGAPNASATQPLFQLGNTISGGNSLANGGTYFGLNAPNTGAGSTADFLNFQYNGTSKLLVTNAGNLTTSGTLSVGAGNFNVDALGNQESLGYYDNGIGGIGQFGNLLNFSEQLDNAAWTANNVTVTANDSGSNPAPDGQTTAEKLFATATNGTVKQTCTTGCTTNSATYTFSVWLKTNSATQQVQLRIDWNNGAGQTGTAASFTANTTWQRFSVTQAVSASGMVSVTPTIIVSNNLGIVAGWGAQLVQSGTAGVYVRTTGAAIAASAGVVSNGGLFVSAINASDKPLIVQGAPSQSGDLLELQNSSGSVLANFDSSGNLQLQHANASITTSSGNNLSIDTGGANTLTVGTNATTINLGSNTATNTINVGSSVGNGATQTINIGTSATTGSTTNVTIGSTIAGSTTIQNVSTINLNASVLATNATNLTLFNSTPTTVAAFSAATSLTIGNTTASSTTNIATGTVAAGNTGTVNIATNATSTGKTATTIGSTNGASSVTLQAGTGNVNLTVSGSSNTGVLIHTNNNSTSAFVIQNTSNVNELAFDTTNGTLKVFDSGGGGNYAYISYSSGTAVFAASSGVTQVGATSGNVTVPLTGVNDQFKYTKTYTPSAAYSTNEFVVQRILTGSANALTGNVLQVENRSTGTNDGSTVLYLNENNASALATGFLIQAQTTATNNVLTLDNSGNLNVSNDYQIGGTAGVTTTCSSGQAVVAGTITGGIATTASCANINSFTTLQNAYTNSSSPATITTTASKGILFADGTAGTTNLFQVQATGSLNMLNIDSLNKIVQIGSATSDANEIVLALDQYNTLADSGTCNSTADPNGAMYYNSSSNEVRACVNGSWAGLVTSTDLDLALYGIIPNSGPGTSDLVSTTANPATQSPCKVYLGSAANTIRWNACTLYAFGRKQVITAQSTNLSLNTTAASGFQQLCITANGNQPTLSASNASQTANLPTFSNTAPPICLATVKENAGNTGIGAVYDTRVFTTSTKQYANITTASAPGYAVKLSGSIGQYAPTSATSSLFTGTVAFTDGSTTGVNAIIVTGGPAYVVSSAGTIGQSILPTATAGIVNTGTGTATAYNNLGQAQSAFSSTCTANATSDDCRASLFTIIDIR